MNIEEVERLQDENENLLNDIKELSLEKFYFDKNIKTIEFISNDEKTIYQRINPNLESNKYYKIEGLKDLDETYGYYVPQSIANTENEEEIAYSIEEILDDDGRI